uniref:2-amino-4-hydroxy-6-hydroxymethyldihydropteridine pyrophosphokinase n=1 Tax=Chlorobium chlorochromatii (strain CaD3) TaxID=340177 RepID=Q3AU17_CHLCH
MQQHTVYIGIGSNIGDRMSHLREALAMLNNLESTSVTAISAIYMTEPVGEINQERFYNGVLAVTTSMQPEALRQECKAIERTIGRPATYQRWSPRVIDLDLLLFDTLVCQTDTLAIPHPELHHRNFVLIPLLDIANPTHPLLGKSIRELLALCPDRSVLIKLQENIAL